MAGPKRVVGAKRKTKYEHEAGEGGVDDHYVEASHHRVPDYSRSPSALSPDPSPAQYRHGMDQSYASSSGMSNHLHHTQPIAPRNPYMLPSTMDPSTAAYPVYDAYAIGVPSHQPQQSWQTANLDTRFAQQSTDPYALPGTVPAYDPYLIPHGAPLSEDSLPSHYDPRSAYELP